MSHAQDWHIAQAWQDLAQLCTVRWATKNKAASEAQTCVNSFATSNCPEDLKPSSRRGCGRRVKGGSTGKAVSAQIQRLTLKDSWTALLKTLFRAAGGRSPG